MSLDLQTYLPIGQKFLQHWRCQADGEAFVTHSSLLWPAKRRGEKMMLKVMDPLSDEVRSAEILRYYDSIGAVRLIDDLDNAQLQERIVVDDTAPSLDQLALNRSDDDATEIICKIASRLHIHAADRRPPDALVPLQRRKVEIRRHLDEGRTQAVGQEIFDVALNIFSDYVDDHEGNFIPLHGDLHHFNILKSQSRGWLAIDPKGMWGPRGYEFTAVLLNPFGYTNFVAAPQRMQRQAAIIAEVTQIESRELYGLTFLNAINCAAWTMDEPNRQFWLACARTAAQLAKITLPE